MARKKLGNNGVEVYNPDEALDIEKAEMQRAEDKFIEQAEQFYTRKYGSIGNFIQVSLPYIIKAIVLAWVILWTHYLRPQAEVECTMVVKDLPPTWAIQWAK